MTGFFDYEGNINLFFGPRMHRFDAFNFSSHVMEI